MADPFLAEIKMVGFLFAPVGWAACDGQLISIQQNTALFSLFGTYYGGNGTSNFALPNLMGRMPMHPGQGPGLSPRELGETGGAQAVTLLQTEMPLHTHMPLANSEHGTSSSPQNAIWAVAATGRQETPMYGPASGLTPMSPSIVGVVGGNQPHNNMPPYLAINFVIATMGIFPSRG